MSKRIRLLCCSSSMAGGGSERQMCQLLHGLSRDLFEPSLYLLYREGPLLDQLPSDVPVTAFWDRHPRPRINWPGRIHHWQIRDLRHIIERDQIDVVYDRLFHMAMIAGPAVRRAGVRRVTHLVSPPAQDLGRSEKRFFWLKRRLLARAYRSADHILTVSGGTADQAAEFYGIDRGRFHVLINPIDLERIDRLRRESWQGMGWDAAAFNLVSLGRLSEEKGHRLLLEAVSRIKERSGRALHLHLIGEGPLQAALERQAQELGIANRVFFHGFHQNPFPLVNIADLFVLPSLYEGLPNALLEAMACEVPALASDCPGGMREVSVDGSLCQLFANGDSHALGHWIEDRIDHPEAWQARAKLARQRVETAHSLPHWLAKMEDFFASAVRL